MTDDAVAYRRVPLEIFTEGKLDVIDDVFAEDYVERMDVPPGTPRNREGVRGFVTDLRTAFPDLRMEVLQQHEDGDIHVGMIRVTGTMSGPFMGMPPSGRSATWDEVHIARFADGKVVEHWGVIDRLSMLQQLGFVPGPPGA